MLLHGRVLRELGKNASKDGVFPNAVSDSAVENMYASIDAFVLAWVWRGHNPLRCAVVLKKASHFGHHILLRARHDMLSATKK